MIAVGRKPLSLGLAVVALALAVAVFIYIGLPAVKDSGSSNSGRITLVCLKCQAESTLKSVDFERLTADRQTRLVQCPRCNEVQAEVTSLRCSACDRAVARQAVGAGFTCPHCKASLGPE
jgi:DNA-directed RNA polymerase subunit RPC12/RpoP